MKKLLAEIAAGKGPALLLLHGDDFRVHEACRALLDLLVPAEGRTLNLERFDGRTTPWGQIEASLMTPPLFSGRKTVFVENVPYLLSQERKGDLVERVLQLWGEEKREEAARLFLDLLVLDGWNQERWEKAKDQNAQSERLLGAGDKADLEELGALFAYCRGRGMDLSRHRSENRDGLTRLLETGLPPWAVLLMTASHVDRRTRLYRRLAQGGAVLDLDLERERSGRIKREDLAGFLDRRLREAGKRVEPQAREMILSRAGDELWAFHQELEKLLLYVGEDPWVRVRDVAEVFLDRGEGWVFDLTESIGQRDAIQSLLHLGRLLAQGEHPLRLLGAIAGEVRRLVATRHLIEGEKRGEWNKGMTFPQFQRAVLRQGGPLVTRSPYGDYRSFLRAENFTTAELLRHLELIYRTDIRLKSSGNPPRIVMERLILEMCRGWDSPSALEDEKG